MKLEEREKGLLKLVDEYRERECRRLLERARAEASELARHSYRKQRAYLHERVVAERNRAQERIQAARAERATRERWETERANLNLLQSAWTRLRARLLARWRDPRGRKRWVETHLGRARGLLPRGLWSVRHAPDWVEEERAELAAELEAILGQAPRFQADAAVEAGLIIGCGGAVLDASLDGLLQDRARLEARLLALFQAGAQS